MFGGESRIKETLDDIGPVKFTDFHRRGWRTNKHKHLKKNTFSISPHSFVMPIQ